MTNYKMNLKTKLLSLSLFFFFCLSAAAQNGPEYNQALAQMLEVSHWEESYSAALKKLASIFTDRISEEKADEWNHWLNDYVERSGNEFMELITPVYAKHLSLEDVQELTRFFKTSVGERSEVEIPEVSQELAPLKLEFIRKVGDELEIKFRQLK